MTDRTHIGESYSAGLAGPADALFPCPKCGRETSEHLDPSFPPRMQDDRERPNARICSQPTCRTVVPLT